MTQLSMVQPPVIQPPQTRPLLQLKNITRSFMAGEREFTALKSIDLTINAGEMVAITGASGSGKSTLMNILGCLDYATAGSYKVNDRETRSLGDQELAALRRDYFGFIFQRYHLLPHLSALHNVEIPAIYAGTPEARRHERAAELLTRLGLAGHMTHRPNQLSGGQQQRVSIARALMNGGEVILADEPTGALDTVSGKEVMNILLELHAAGHTVIIVTHDPKVAANAERIIEVRDGEIVSDLVNERAGPALDRKSTRLNSSHTEIYTLSLHDALPIYRDPRPEGGGQRRANHRSPRWRNRQRSGQRTCRPGLACRSGADAQGQRRTSSGGQPGVVQGGVHHGLGRADLPSDAHPVDHARDRYRHHLGGVDRGHRRRCQTLRAQGHPGHWQQHHRCLPRHQFWRQPRGSHRNPGAC